MRKIIVLVISLLLLLMCIGCETNQDKVERKQKDALVSWQLEVREVVTGHFEIYNQAKKTMQVAVNQWNDTGTITEEARKACSRDWYALLVSLDETIEKLENIDLPPELMNLNISEQLKEIKKMQIYSFTAQKESVEMFNITGDHIAWTPENAPRMIESSNYYFETFDPLEEQFLYKEVPEF